MDGRTRRSLMASAAFTGLSAVPTTYGWAGHTTHFIVLFPCAGVFALLKSEQQSSLPWMMISGISFGIAILMKQHAVAFPAFIILWLIWEKGWTQRVVWKKVARQVGVFSIGCVIPFLVTCIILACAGVWDKFYYWTIEYASAICLYLSPGALPRTIHRRIRPYF